MLSTVHIHCHYYSKINSLLKKELRHIYNVTVKKNLWVLKRHFIEIHMNIYEEKERDREKNIQLWVDVFQSTAF